MPDTSLPIVGAYHVATFPGWERLVRAQCERLRTSGLLAATETLLVGVVGDLEGDMRPLLTSLLDGKADLHAGGPLGRYEFPTLERLHQEACRRDFAAYYLHTKGVSSGTAGAERHRLLLESVVLDNHRTCRELLAEYDACGPDWKLEGFGQPHPHFAGNFWWARASYLRTLPPPASLNAASRYEAEFWVGGRPGVRVFRLDYPGDPFAKPSAWKGLESHYRELAGLGEGRAIERIVDVGVDYGFSTFHFAKDFPQAEVIGISDFRLHEDSERWVRSHAHLFPNLRLIKGDSAAAGKQFGRPVDLLNIDGDHAFESVVRDFSAWIPWVRPGGAVLFHDVQSFASVRTFFEGLGGRKREIPQHHGLGCWFCGPPERGA